MRLTVTALAVFACVACVRGARITIPIYSSQTREPRPERYCAPVSRQTEIDSLNHFSDRCKEQLFGTRYPDLQLQYK